MTGPKYVFGQTEVQKSTLSDECLARVQQDVAALDDHPLDGQILPDVLRVAHLIVHHPDGMNSHQPTSLDAKHECMYPVFFVFVPEFREMFELFSNSNFTIFAKLSSNFKPHKNVI